MMLQAMGGARLPVLRRTPVRRRLHADCPAEQGTQHRGHHSQVRQTLGDGYKQDLWCLIRSSLQMKLSYWNQLCFPRDVARISGTAMPSKACPRSASGVPQLTSQPSAKERRRPSRRTSASYHGVAPQANTCRGVIKPHGSRSSVESVAAKCLLVVRPTCRDGTVMAAARE